MKKEAVYWKTKDGHRINVDDMDDNHVRNALKMLIRKIHAYEQAALLADTQKKLNGDMAREFNDSFPGDEDYPEDYCGSLKND